MRFIPKALRGRAASAEPGAPEPLRPTFRSTDHEARFRADGYLTVENVFTPAQIAELRARFESLGWRSDEHVVHNSNADSPPDYRRALHEIVVAALGPVVDRLMVDHQPFSSGAVAKSRGEDGEMPVHQDWTMVDESRFRSVNAWLPLCDVSPENGGLAVVPGSHRMFTGDRANPGRPPWLADPFGGVSPAMIRSVPMKAGSCLFLDHALAHGSPPNTVDDARPVLVMATAPREATLRHLWLHPDSDRVDQYEVTDPDFFRFCTPGIEPSHPSMRLVETRDFRLHPDAASGWLTAQIAAEFPSRVPA